MSNQATWRRPALLAALVIVVVVAGSVGVLALSSEDDAVSDEGLEHFCFVVMGVDYAAGLDTIEDRDVVADRTAAASAARLVLGDLADEAPPELENRAREVVEGVERAIEEGLTSEERQRYVDAFRELREQSSDVCQTVTTE